MKKHISAAEIGQFRHVVSEINRSANFIGVDENGDAIYDPTLKKPTLRFKGTVKLHGTFASVCYNNVDGIWFQSKGQIITVQKDNNGFAFFGTTREDIFIEIIRKIAFENNIDLDNNSIMLCMEWVGKGIQKNVGISNLEKSAFIFSQAKVRPFDIEKNSYWVSTELITKYASSEEDRIFNIQDYKTFVIDIDFNNPQMVQNDIIKMTLEVEKECPVAKYFNEIGIGEGIVFTHLLEDGSRYIFKSKGDKHAGKSKVKTLKPVDIEKLKLVERVAYEVTPIWRLNQFFNELTNNGEDIDRKYIGNYIRAVISDVYKEDIDIVSENGLEPKELNPKISNIAKEYFFEQEKI